MTARVRMNSVLLPLLTLGMLVMQLLDPSKIWQALIVAFGGLWLVAGLWAWSLKNHLRLTREVRLARPVTGYASKDQTAYSFSLALTKRLSAIKTSTLLQNRLTPAQNEINQLTELFSRSLFAPSLPTRTEAKKAIKTWSRLRWRLLLANVLTKMSPFALAQGITLLA